MEVSLDGGDLFLSTFFFGEKLRQVVLTGKRVCSFVVKVWFWSCASWALSRGAALKRVSVSRDWVVVINVGITDCQARHGAAACRWTAEPTPSPPSLSGKKKNGDVTSR